MKTNETKLYRVDTVVFLICIILFAFTPFSYNGEIFRSFYIIKNLFTLVFVLFYCLFRAKLIRSQIITVLSIHLILFYFTFVVIISGSTSNEIGFASYSVLVSLSILWLSKFKNNIFFPNITIIFNVVNLIFILWSLGIIHDIEWIKLFTFNYFSQFSDYTLPNMLSRNKPVLSFGTHSISSYVTFMLFMLNYITVKKQVYKSNKLNYFFMWCYLYTNIMTFSNTSLIVSMIIVILLLVLYKKITYLFFIIPTIIAIIISVINSGILDSYIQRMTTRENNGFLARYFGELYTTNFEYVMNYGGVGLISDNSKGLFLIDSGFLVLFTQGNILLVLIFFFALFKFIYNNVEKRFVMHIYLPIMLFEVAATFLLLDVRPIFLLLMVVIYLKSLNNMDRIKTSS